MHAQRNARRPLVSEGAGGVIRVKRIKKMPFVFDINLLRLLFIAVIQHQLSAIKITARIDGADFGVLDILMDRSDVLVLDPYTGAEKIAFHILGDGCFEMVENFFQPFCLPWFGILQLGAFMHAELDGLKFFQSDCAWQAHGVLGGFDLLLFDNAVVSEIFKIAIHI